MSLAEALTVHRRGLVLLSKGTEEMAERGRKAIEEFATTGWEQFSPVQIWTDYRKTGIERQGFLLGSAANHLRWYLLKFVPWAVKRGLLGQDALESLAEVPRLKVNSRQIRVPTVAEVAEFLAMVESEDAEGGAFLRFLTVTGLRLSGALNLEWSDIDLGLGTMAIMQKGGWKKVIPMTPEAVELVTDRRGRRKPCPLDIKALERVERRMKRFAKGLDIDLKTFHSFRHYFASRCLLSGIRAATGAHVLLVHHCGKDEARGARGHSSLRAAVDTEIEISRPEGETISTVRATKQRDLSPGEAMPFSLKQVTLGTDRRGNRRDPGGREAGPVPPRFHARTQGARCRCSCGRAGRPRCPAPEFPP